MSTPNRLPTTLREAFVRPPTRPGKPALLFHAEAADGAPFRTDALAYFLMTRCGSEEVAKQQNATKAQEAEEPSPEFHVAADGSDLEVWDAADVLKATKIDPRYALDGHLVISLMTHADVLAEDSARREESMQQAAAPNRSNWSM